MSAIEGAGTSAQIVRISPGVSGSSTKTMSAPRDCARSMASVSPWARRASVRARITVTRRAPAATAARMRSDASSRSTTDLPALWPQRLAARWSSIVTPAAPARAQPSTVRSTSRTLPCPLSPSTVIGMARSSITERAQSSISPLLVSPVSGAPIRAAAAATPESKVSSNPARSLSRADRPS